MGGPRTATLLDYSTLQHIADQVFDLLTKGAWYVLISFLNRGYAPRMDKMINGLGATTIFWTSHKDEQMLHQQLMEEVLLGKWVFLEGFDQLVQQLLILFNI